MASSQLVQPNSAVGIIAAQSIGEPSTQLKLDSKHSGGLATLSSHAVSTGINRVEELFEMRPPKGAGYLAPFAGEVSLEQSYYQHFLTVRAASDYVWRKTAVGLAVRVKAKQAVSEGQLVAVLPDHEAVLSPAAGKVEVARAGEISIKPDQVPEYRCGVARDQTLLVKPGQTVAAGERLTSGSLRLDELLALRGKAAAQHYILLEVSRVFASQGSPVADKHLEIIIRQMFQRVKIIDAGDSSFIEDDIVSVKNLTLENRQLVADKKQPAVWQQLVLGITKINRYADSFLTAASSHDTTRVLVDAAVRGRVDNLSGLIENILLGSKIPVGTGAVSNVYSEDFENM